MWFKRKKKQQIDYLPIIVDFIVEEWRFLRSYKAIINKLATDDISKYQSTYNFHADKINDLLAQLNLKIVDMEGKEYNDGLSIKALNIDSFKKKDVLIVSQMIEPLIISSVNGKTVHAGAVMLIKQEKEVKQKEQK